MLRWSYVACVSLLTLGKRVFAEVVPVALESLVVLEVTAMVVVSDIDRESFGGSSWASVSLHWLSLWRLRALKLLKRKPHSHE